MRLVKTTALVFSEGRTDKVYEIDLCEVGAGKYVVNFRYGKRGAALKDGSKTPLPVSQVEAERAFNKAVGQQREKGYVPAGEARPAPPTPASAPAPVSMASPSSAAASAQHQRIVERLAAHGVQGRWFKRQGQEKTWSLERAIWRAGELRVREAEPHLLRLLGTAPLSAKPSAGGRGVRDYCIAWALGRMGGPDAMQPLTRLFGDARAPEHVKRIATLALLALSDETTRAEFADHTAGQLPAELQGPVRGEDAAAFSLALRNYLQKSPPGAFSVVDSAYVIDSPTVRAGILEQVSTVALTPPFFQSLRHIFKAAEYRRDGQVFGVLAHRIEKTRANPASSSLDSGHTAYGRPTRRYLQRRVWRTLRRLGQLGDVDYVKMAVGVLLPFTDADAAAESTRGDRWAPYWAFNHVLYDNSPRYEPAPNGRSFRCRRGTRPGAPPPPTREEAFPKLWEAKPEGLMHLLVESRCAPVHEMAAKAIRACPGFLNQLDVDDVVALLGAPYEVTSRLALELAEKRYQPDAPSLPLLLALATCNYAPARARGHQWLDEQRTRVLADSSILAALVLAPHVDTRSFARRLLKSQVFSAEAASPLVARIVAAMLVLGQTPEDDVRARDATQTLVDTLASHLSGVQDSVLADLLAHPASGVQQLGAELLLRRKSALVSDEILVKVLHSPHENVRAVGLRMLAELPDDVLAGMELLLVRLTTDRNADLRHASRPIVVRVCARFRPTAETVMNALVLALIRNKLPEGAPSHVLKLLKGELFPLARELPTTDIWRLLQSQSAHAQELGGLLLQHRDPSDFTLDQIVHLASHEILSVRQASWKFFGESLVRVRSQMAEASRILDARWEDSRQFAFQFFREKLGAEAFTADVLVTILDSVREDVQAFGRELTTRYFREDEGPVLMEKLAEHPQVAVQLFVTNYLERYANDVKMLERLVPYFRSVLSRVNQGRIAKKRVLNFLEAQGAQTPEAARVVLDLLHGLSATIAIEYRGAAIAAMMSIHRAQPSIPMQLRVKTPTARGAHGVPVRV